MDKVSAPGATKAWARRKIPLSQCGSVEHASVLSEQSIVFLMISYLIFVKAFLYCLTAYFDTAKAFPGSHGIYLANVTGQA